MKYERLTNGNFDGQCDHWTSLAFMGGTIGCWNEAEERYMLCEECIHKQRYDRLKELEDKIEAGTLAEVGTLFIEYDEIGGGYLIRKYGKQSKGVEFTREAAEKRLEKLRGEV